MSQSPTFQLPVDGLTYSRDIFQRCFDLVTFDIWKDLDPSQLRKWLNNFTTPEEKYFAACILDGLIYRPKDQTISLVKQLFGRVLPDLTRLDPCPLGYIDNWEERLAHAGDPGLRLVVVVREGDPPTKSAHYVARLMKREFSVKESWIISPRRILSALAKGIRVFVFVDDFLATGDQFANFLYDQPFRLVAQCYLVYAPLAAHTSGINQLRQSFPTLHVAPVETLDQSYGLFSPESRCFDDGVNNPQSAKVFYEQMLSSKGVTIDPAIRGGYGDLELAYGFEHAAPNNCLAILWWWRSSGWTPLFRR